MVRPNALAAAGAFLLSVLATPDARPSPGAPAQAAKIVDATTLRGKVMCGYQGWFRCPGDAARVGWSHWSRDANRLAPDTLSFEMWPDVSEYGPSERFATPGFTLPDGRPAELFSSDSAATVLRHFGWMRSYNIDGAWLQQFLVDLPGGTLPERYPSRARVLSHVQSAARQTGRTWAISYDIAGLPTERIFDVLTSDWKKMVDTKITRDARYLHEKRRPVVQVWGFYHNNPSNQMTAELANKLIGFFRAPGRYSAFLVGGGDWDWRGNPDPQWQAFLRRFDAYVPWNVGNYSLDEAGVKHASTGCWADDRKRCEQQGTLWIPSIYPGFGWDNLTRQPPGTSAIARRGGQFLWEQFHELAKMKQTSVYVAMFDEVDEGTAIFKVTSSPPTQGHFVGYEGLPSDWYLRLVGEGTRMLCGQRPITPELPLRPEPS